MGIPFLRRRKSTFIDGAADDARDLSAHLASYLDGGGGETANRGLDL
jgi:putative flavoprotein involved in K+ transport